MKTILIFGAGKSATSLIDYLGKYCDENNDELIVCDSDLSLAKAKTGKFSQAGAVSFDVGNQEKLHHFISLADIVISMLPAALHFLVAKACVTFSKSLLTASYIDDNIKSLEAAIEQKKILFLCEMGLDPGIDHMSAMKMIHNINSKGGKITSFKSHCGGLIAPESDNNPWHYKITWNPANVVAAGSAGAVYRCDGETVRVPYAGIFKDNQEVDVPGLFPLAWYANRDSLSYMDTYQLHDVRTFIRTTLRYPSYCRGWDKIIKLGLTDKNDDEEINGCLTFSDWFYRKKNKLILPNESNFFNAEFLEQADFIELRSNHPIPRQLTNSALILQYLLEKNLVMLPHDKDMIVMLHEMEYLVDATPNKISSYLVVFGEDQLRTAMAKTVGLPLGIAAKLILENKIELTGLHIPVIADIYEPVLRELEINGIKFQEEESVA